MSHRKRIWRTDRLAVKDEEGHNSWIKEVEFPINTVGIASEEEIKK